MSLFRLSLLKPRLTCSHFTYLFNKSQSKVNMNMLCMCLIGKYYRHIFRKANI